MQMQSIDLITTLLVEETAVRAEKQMAGSPKPKEADSKYDFILNGESKAGNHTFDYSNHS